MSDAAVDPFAAAEQATPTRLSTGYSWAECPRWHDGAFWFSDMYNHALRRLDSDGNAETVLDLSGRTPVQGDEVVPGGFGWLPDGRLIVNSMHERLVLVWDGETVAEYADLRELAGGPINDMVVDADGRAYITQLGFELFQGEAAKDSPLLVVEPDGSARALDELGVFAAANGIAVSADGTRVVTAESFGVEVVAFDRDEHGVLSNRRTFATLSAPGDGMCLDSEGAAWVASPAGGFVVRVEEGGRITDVAHFANTEVIPNACVLGGPDRSTLHVTGGLEVFDWAKSRTEGLGSVWTLPARVAAGTARP
jgi:sugar lactone lactonase YvrE